MNPVYSFSESYSICDGETYNWQGIDYTAGGIYTANYSSIHTCDSSYTLTLTVNTVDVTTSVNDPEISANATGASYQWLDCNNSYAPVPGETGQSFTASFNGSFAVELTENACVDTSACGDIYAVGMKETNNVEGIVVFPNPADESITIQLSPCLIGTMYSLRSPLGQTVQSGRIVSEHTMISIKELAGGIYVLLIGDDHQRSFRVMKK